ncbi:MAG: hypothetical protein Q9174_003815 [Haloplaca sp. 1 TL-2023]
MRALTTARHSSHLLSAWVRHLWGNAVVSDTPVSRGLCGESDGEHPIRNLTLAVEVLQDAQSSCAESGSDQNISSDLVDLRPLARAVCRSHSRGQLLRAHATSNIMTTNFYAYYGRRTRGSHQGMPFTAYPLALSASLSKRELFNP